MDEGVQRMLVRFADDTKFGGIANTLQDRNNIQNDLDRIEHWAESIRVKFKRDKCKLLHLGKNKSITRWGIPGSAKLRARRILELL